MPTYATQHVSTAADHANGQFYRGHVGPTNQEKLGSTGDCGGSTGHDSDSEDDQGVTIGRIRDVAARSPQPELRPVPRRAVYAMHLGVWGTTRVISYRANASVTLVTVPAQLVSTISGAVMVKAGKEVPVNVPEPRHMTLPVEDGEAMYNVPLMRASANSLVSAASNVP